MSDARTLTQYILQQVQQRRLSKEMVYPLLKKIVSSNDEDSINSLLLEYQADQPELYVIADYWRANSEIRESGACSALSLKLRADEAGVYFRRIPKGIFESNCYLLAYNGEGVIIDPGSGFEKIIDICHQTNALIKYIIITHGHFDHVFSMEQLRQATGAAIVMHPFDEPLLSAAYLNGSLIAGTPQVFALPDIRVNEGDVLDIGGMKLNILHTPGHTEGCISIVTDNYLFSGDVMFKGKIGSVDTTGNGSDLLKSYRRLLGLSPSLLVCPGHGQISTVFEEVNV